jgi:hypothetical protein
VDAGDTKTVTTTGTFTGLYGTLHLSADGSYTYNVNNNNAAVNALNVSSTPLHDEANRSAAIDTVIEADPIASRIRAIMADRTIWLGSASDLLVLCSESAREGASAGNGWAKNPRALAGRLRRAQTFLRTLGIEITFSREGRTGTRVIRVSKTAGEAVSSVSSISIVSARVHGTESATGLLGDGEYRSTYADDADGADAKPTPLRRSFSLLAGRKRRRRPLLSTLGFISSST